MRWLRRQAPGLRRASGAITRDQEKMGIAEATHEVTNRAGAVEAKRYNGLVAPLIPFAADQICWRRSTTQIYILPV